VKYGNSFFPNTLQELSRFSFGIAHITGPFRWNCLRPKVSIEMVYQRPAKGFGLFRLLRHRLAKLAVVRYFQSQQFVYDDLLAEVFGLREEVQIEAQPS